MCHFLEGFPQIYPAYHVETNILLGNVGIFVGQSLNIIYIELSGVWPRIEQFEYKCVMKNFNYGGDVEKPVQ